MTETTHSHLQYSRNFPNNSEHNKTRSNNEVILELLQARYPEKKLGLADVEQAQNENAMVNQALFEKYQSLYPDAKITDLFLLDIRRHEADIETCENCKGYPCSKSNEKGIKYFVTTFTGKLTVEGCRCCFSKAAQAQAQAKANKTFSTAKIPARFIGKTFSDYEIDDNNKAAVEKARQLGSLYISGSVGTGKTFLASIVAQELLRQGKSVVFGDVPTLLDELKSTFDDNAKSTFKDLMNILSNVDVLILDDFGSEKPSDWAAEKLYTIINNRYNSNKTLIITSNFTIAELKNYYGSSNDEKKGGRIVSRIIDLCAITSLKGRDRRFDKFH